MQGALGGEEERWEWPTGTAGTALTLRERLQAARNEQAAKCVCESRGRRLKGRPLTFKVTHAWSYPVRSGAENTGLFITFTTPNRKAWRRSRGAAWGQLLSFPASMLQKQASLNATPSADGSSLAKLCQLTLIGTQDIAEGALSRSIWNTEPTPSTPGPQSQAALQPFTGCRPARWECVRTVSHPLPQVLGRLGSCQL